MRVTFTLGLAGSSIGGTSKSMVIAFSELWLPTAWFFASVSGSGAFFLVTRGSATTFAAGCSGAGVASATFESASSPSTAVSSDVSAAATSGESVFFLLWRFFSPSLCLLTLCCDKRLHIWFFSF